jgi:hypothetical protein
MKKILIVTAAMMVMFAFPGTNYAASNFDQEDIKVSIDTVTDSPCLNEPNDKTEMSRRGCCSHHGGVCGCSSTGRAECCDGTLSPSCGC